MTGVKGTETYLASVRRLFLIDALGALTTAFMLGLVLTHFQVYFGMPRNVLQLLALVAVAFFVYSFACYLRLPEKWRVFLWGIAVANLLYCVLTLSLVVYWYGQLTPLGILYFAGEALIIVVLAITELRVAHTAG